MNVPPDPESVRSRKRAIWAYVRENPNATALDIMIALRLTIPLHQIVRDIGYNQKARRAWKGDRDDGQGT